MIQHNKYLSFSVACFLFLGTSIPFIDIVPQDTSLFNTSSGDDCYGFIIPLPDNNHLDETPSVQNYTLNLINDLLRQKIPVYWSNTTCNVFVTPTVNDSNPQSYTLTPGSFIVPFTNQHTQNNQIIATMTDYGVHHELYENITTVTNYLLLEPITLKSCYRLTEPKAAFYYGDGVYTSSLNWYVYTLHNAGFLNLAYLDDTDIISSLNNEDYNLLIWPGGQYRNDLNSNISFFTRLLRQREIKAFVRQGGGYVGSCYGAYAASSGMRLFPFPFIAYLFPTLTSPGLFLGMQDSFTAMAIPCYFNITIDDQTHPVLFGSNSELQGSKLIGGCVYPKVGKNTRSLATVKEIDSLTWYHLFRDLFQSNDSIAHKIIDYWITFTTGKTIWTTSHYGDGTIVTFGDHPEIGDVHLQRIIHNAVLYVSSDQIDQVTLDLSLNILDIKANQEKTKNLSFSTDRSDEFLDVSQDIQQVHSTMMTVQNHTNSIIGKTRSLMENGTIDWSLAVNIFISGIWDFSGTIQRSLLYTSDNSTEENILTNLDKIDHIIALMDHQNFSIEPIITSYKTNLTLRLSEMNATLDHILSSLSSLDLVLSSYQGSSQENESIINLCDTIAGTSKHVEKNFPRIFFDTIKILRDIWYLYESQIQ